MKCYNGLTQNGKESPGMEIKQADCEHGMDECATVKYSMSILGMAVKATQATCTSKALNCQLCSFLESTITGLGECNVRKFFSFFFFFFGWFKNLPAF